MADNQPYGLGGKNSKDEGDGIDRSLATVKNPGGKEKPAPKDVAAAKQAAKPTVKLDDAGRSV
jgi:hypothetical protein